MVIPQIASKITLGKWWAFWRLSRQFENRNFYKEHNSLYESCCMSCNINSALSWAESKTKVSAKTIVGDINDGLCATAPRCLLKSEMKAEIQGFD